MSIEGIRKGYLSVKNGIFKGKRLDLGAEPTLIKLCCVLPPSFILGLINFFCFKLTIMHEHAPKCYLLNKQLSAIKKVTIGLAFVYGAEAKKNERLYTLTGVLYA